MSLPSKLVTASNICLKDKNEIVLNATKNCSIFKNYFSDLAQNLVFKLPPSPNIFSEFKVVFYHDNNAVSNNLIFQLLERPLGKILSIFKGLNRSKEAGIDIYLVNFLKDATDVLAWPILQLWNLPIKLNSFPPSCEIAKVKPLFKKGSKTNSQNYRLISLLPLLLKIIERIVHDQAEEFLSNSKILYSFQSGFQKNYSTNTCLRILLIKLLPDSKKRLTPLTSRFY